MTDTEGSSHLFDQSSATLPPAPGNFPEMFGTELTKKYQKMRQGYDSNKRPAADRHSNFSAKAYFNTLVEKGHIDEPHEADSLITYAQMGIMLDQDKPSSWWKSVRSNWGERGQRKRDSLAIMKKVGRDMGHYMETIKQKQQRYIQDNSNGREILTVIAESYFEHPAGVISAQYKKTDAFSNSLEEIYTTIMPTPGFFSIETFRFNPPGSKNPMRTIYQVCDTTSRLGKGIVDSAKNISAIFDRMVGQVKTNKA